VAAGTAGRQQGCSIGCTCDDRPALLVGFDRPGVVLPGVKFFFAGREQSRHPIGNGGGTDGIRDQIGQDNFGSID